MLINSHTYDTDYIIMLNRFCMLHSKVAIRSLNWAIIIIEGWLGGRYQPTLK